MIAVSVIELGPCEGFQSGPRPIGVALRAELIDALFDAGLRQMQVGGFAGRGAWPLQADTGQVLSCIRRGLDRLATVVVASAAGAERAIAAGVDEIVLRLTLSDSDRAAPHNHLVVLSVGKATPIVRLAQQAGLPVRASVATAFGCALEGEAKDAAMQRMMEALQTLGITEVTLDDSAGMATPPILCRTLRAVRRTAPEALVTLRLRNTRGLALVNAMAALEEGVASFEATVAGLGARPAVPDPEGACCTEDAVCTEDLVHMLHALDLQTGIDLGALIAVARRVEHAVGLAAPGHVMHAGPHAAA